MGNVVHNFPVQRRRESRLETRLILRQLLAGRAALNELSTTRLHEREVASFILKCTKCLWAASESAEMGNLTRLLEAVFSEAYVRAGGDCSKALELFRSQQPEPKKPD